jgi:hypothetical protein
MRRCSGTSSMQPEMGRMQGFVAALLAREGALVDAIEPEGLEVLATPPVQQALELPELCRLGFGATLPSGARRVGLENDWLERLGGLLGERGRWARQVLRPEMRALSDPERVLGHELVLDNATFRLLGVAPAWTRYLILDFRFAAVSDEKREGVLRLGVNQATGAMPDVVLQQIAPWLTADDTDPRPPDDDDLPPAWERRRVLNLIAQALAPRLAVALIPFVNSLQRRLSRDQERLYAYHNDLHRETLRRLSAMPDEDPARRREEQRCTAIARDYQAKIDDLARQYAMRVMVEWVQTLELVMPVQRFEVQIRRRKAQRVICLDWNPLARRLESPVCEFSRAGERPRLVCDEAIHLVTPAGLAPCSNCAKAFCRACHRQECPKCSHAVHRFSLTGPGLHPGLR